MKMGATEKGKLSACIKRKTWHGGTGRRGGQPGEGKTRLIFSSNKGRRAFHQRGKRKALARRMRRNLDGTKRRKGVSGSEEGTAAWKEQDIIWCGEFYRGFQKKELRTE